MRVIKVEELDMMGCPSGTKYFKSLNKAKKYFKELIKTHKKDLAEDEDCSYEDRAIRYGDKPLDFLYKAGARNKEVHLECWYCSETQDGTEWDTESISIILREIKIES